MPYFFVGDQCQMRTPFRKETKAVGHAVLGMYLYSGAADVYAETGEKALMNSLDQYLGGCEPSEDVCHRCSRTGSPWCIRAL